jgi:membrane protein DedA with SNARE-associated domain
MPGKQRANRRVTLARIAALLAVILISIYIFSIRDQAAKLAIYGYPGIFLLSFLAYATVILPAPGIAIIFTMGTIFNPLAVGLAAGAGAALGELVGYLAGFSGQAVVEHADQYERLTRWMNRNGPLTIFFLALVPNPFFDVAGIIAGMLKMPFIKFLFWCWVGETLKMTMFAYLGSKAINWFQ